MKATKLINDPSKEKECAISNQTSSDAVIIIPTTGQTDNSGSSIAVYDQDLEILTTTEGGQTIKSSASGTVVLDQSYKDPTTGKETYSLVYNLLVSASDWYFPLANIGLMQDIFSPPASFPDQTAFKAEAAAIQNASVFYQTIQSYPTSQLTKNYQKAMSGAQTDALNKADGSANSTQNASDSITSNVNAFFASTKEFQNVTLAGVVAVESYYDKFPFVWAEYGTTTYYLYSSDGTNTSFVGQLSLQKPATIDVTKPNAGYTCTFSPAKDSTNLDSVDIDSSKASAITYSSGVFVNDLTVDIPAIAVKGTFQLKRLFTQQSADTSIITVITGSINGATVIGFDQPQLKSDTSSSFWNTLFHPKTSQQVFSSIMEIGGAIMMLHFFATSLYGMGKWLKNKVSGKEATTTEADLKSQMEDFQKSMNDKIDEAVKKISDGKESAPSDPDDALGDIVEERGTVVDNLNASNVESALEAESATLEELAQYSSDMTTEQLQLLESNATSIQDSNSALSDATPEELHDVVQNQTSNLSDIRDSVGDLIKDLDSYISAESKQQIDANKEISEQASEDIENSESDASEDESADDPVAEDPIIPEV
jgi:hypothetical protein